MSKITQDAGLDNITDDKDKWRFLSVLLDQVKTILNNGLNFSDNFVGKQVSANFSVASTDVAIAHGLGRVPTGYLITSKSASMIVYTGATAWTSSTINLRASAVGTAGVIIF